ncbi:thionin-like protein 2 [Papaver somniferum]|uniref:thionin-like protein 2 n=1 Tax=Papaver somniferum TaxID=3469 RepID=UPI000E6FCB03|nr:thionin-like protein 2 [Papaver somniferum]
MAMLILGMFVGKSVAGNDYDRCYVTCLAYCQEWVGASLCPDECERECKSPDHNKVTAVTARNYCKLGCAAMNCNKNNPQNLNGKEAKDCYNVHCGNECTR